MNLCPAGEAMRGKRCFAFPYYCRRIARELLPARGGGADGFAVFFYAGLGLCGRLTTGARSRDSRTVWGQEVSACITHLSGVARELIPPQAAPENCSRRRWRQRVASTAGGFIDKIFGWVYNNAVCCRGFPALDSKQRSVTP